MSLSLLDRTRPPPDLDVPTPHVPAFTLSTPSMPSAPPLSASLERAESALQQEVSYLCQELDPQGRLKEIALEIDRQAGVVSAGHGLDIEATGRAGVALYHALSGIMPAPHFIHECIELFKIIWRRLTGFKKPHVSHMADGQKVYTATFAGSAVRAFNLHELNAALLRHKLHRLHLSQMAVQTHELDTQQRAAEARGVDTQEITRCVTSLRKAARKRDALSCSLGGGGEGAANAAQPEVQARRLDDKTKCKHLFTPEET